jgi:soluble lytic murein transglycosylase
MERFDNAYPLAVGSYNGGPHNMSRWYRDRMGTWEMDEFVEHIPYDETRRYIKKVTGHYAQYVEYYFDENHMVLIPDAPLKDDASIIDF